MLLNTPKDVCDVIAARSRDRRRERGWSQRELAERAGVALPTLKVFERTGRISLERLLRIAATLDAMDAFERVFEPPVARSLDEIEARTRKHGAR